MIHGQPVSNPQRRLEGLYLVWAFVFPESLSSDPDNTFGGGLCNDDTDGCYRLKAVCPLAKPTWGPRPQPCATPTLNSCPASPQSRTDSLPLRAPCHPTSCIPNCTIPQGTPGPAASAPTLDPPVSPGPRATSGLR